MAFLNTHMTTIDPIFDLSFCRCHSYCVAIKCLNSIASLSVPSFARLKQNLRLPESDNHEINPFHLIISVIIFLNSVTVIDWRNLLKRYHTE